MKQEKLNKLNLAIVFVLAICGSSALAAERELQVIKSEQKLTADKKVNAEQAEQVKEPQLPEKEEAGLGRFLLGLPSQESVTGHGLVPELASLIAAYAEPVVYKLDVTLDNSSATEIAFSPNGQILASGSQDYTVKLWDVTGKALHATLEGHTARVGSVAFSPDGQTLASGSDDDTVKLWNVTSKALQATLEGHSHWVLSVAFSPAGLTLASGSWDGTVQLWDITSKALQATLKGHCYMVLSVAFSPDGHTLVSSSTDKTIKFWRRQTPVQAAISEARLGGGSAKALNIKQKSEHHVYQRTYKVPKSAAVIKKNIVRIKKS